MRIYSTISSLYYILLHCLLLLQPELELYSVCTLKLKRQRLLNTSSFGNYVSAATSKSFSASTLVNT